LGLNRSVKLKGRKEERSFEVISMADLIDSMIPSAEELLLSSQIPMEMPFAMYIKPPNILQSRIVILTRERKIFPVLVFTRSNAPSNANAFVIHQNHY
jgi:hypothetical protein